MNGLGCSPFARRYLGNRGCFLFLQVLRCFNSLRSLPRAYFIQRAVVGMTPHRFPDSEILGSMPVSGSPGLFAAVHVLHRLPIPRHPPYTLGNLAVSFRRTSVQGKNASFLCCSVRFSKTALPRSGCPVREEILFSAGCGFSHVELIGFEPTTPGLQSRCSPS